MTILVGLSSSPRESWGELHKFRVSGRAPLPALGRAADFATIAVFWTMRPCLLMGGVAAR